MTPGERIRTTYRGGRPDRMPYMLDLSHWFYHRDRRPWDLSRAYDEPEHDLIECHRRLGVGFYMPNLGSFYSVSHAPDVGVQVVRENCSGHPVITWKYSTPLGSLERTREWDETTYSWAIREWAVRDPGDLRALGCALAGRTYAPRWDRYRAWRDCVGDLGVVYLPMGYSAMGHLLSYWMGVEAVMYAIHDAPEIVEEFVTAVNRNALDLVDLACQSPAEVVLMGDNFSSDVQPPGFFARWSRDYYAEAIRRFHAAGKAVAVHVDGRLRGLLDALRGLDVDCIDAVTPAPMGDLTPAECRREAGDQVLLSGGVSPDLWLPDAPMEAFREAVHVWIALWRENPRLIAAAGDQVPPGAEEARIHVMRDLVEAAAG